MKRKSIWGAAIALVMIALGTPHAEATLIVFDFNDGEGWDNPAVVGATMTAGGITATVEDILGWDGTAFTWNSAGGEHRMNINGNANALGVNSSASQGFEANESRDIDEGEAFRFSFDTDVYLVSINQASLDGPAEMTLSSTAFSDVVVTSASVDPYDLGYTLVPADTVISLANTATSAGGGEFRVTEWTIDTIPEPSTFGLVAFFGGGLLFIRRKLRI